MQSDQEIPLTGAQRGLVFSATSEGNIVHWPGVRPFNDPSVSSRLVGMNRMMSRLPFQVGTPLPIIEEEGSTEILSSALTAESGTNSTVCYAHSREVYGPVWFLQLLKFLSHRMFRHMYGVLNID